MNVWKEYQFGELVDFPPKISLKKGDEYPFIDMDAINPSSRYVENNQLRKYDSSGSAKFMDRDVLLARITPCLENGKIAQVKLENSEGGFGSTEFFVFRSKPKLLNQNFLYYLAKSDLIWKNAVNSMVGASGRQRAEASFLKRVKLEIPPLEEQKKIAAILSVYDDLIENNKRRIALLEKMAEEIYREWFVRSRFPGYQTAKFEKGIPKEWNLVPFSKAVEINPTERLFKEDLKPYVGMDALSTNSMYFKPSEYRQGSSGSKFRNGDTLFPRITPCLENGKRGYVMCLEKDEVGIGSTEFIVMREKLLTSEFIYLLSCFEPFRTHAEISMVGASGRQRVSENCFSFFLIPIPHKEVLNKFSEIVRPMFESIRILSNENSYLEITRDRLLPRLISGKLSVENLDIQFPPSMQEDRAA